MNSSNVTSFYFPIHRHTIPPERIDPVFKEPEESQKTTWYKDSERPEFDDDPHLMNQFVDQLMISHIYLMMFSVLAPFMFFWIWLANVVVLRLQARALLYRNQRMVPMRAVSLQFFNSVLFITHQIANISNAVFIALHTEIITAWTYESDHGTLNGFFNTTQSYFPIEKIVTLMDKLKFERTANVTETDLYCL